MHSKDNPFSPPMKFPSTVGSSSREKSIKEPPSSSPSSSSPVMESKSSSFQGDFSSTMINFSDFSAPKSSFGEMVLPQPLESLHAVPIPPFLSKTYELIEDPSLDPVITWGETGQSFVVWDPMEFARAVLPRHFKHNNFSSFVRQLNTYGFRKVDTDRWEFANEDFLQGKKHLLKNIHRRKSSQTQQIGHYVGSSIEMGKAGIEGEVENLKKERNALMQEVVKLQQEHQVAAHQVDTMKQRLQAAEQRQKQMVSFLAKVLQNPVFLAHLKSQKEHREIASTRVKRKFLKQNQANQSNLDSPVEGQIVRYKTDWSDATTSLPTDLKSDTGKQIPDYLLHDMVGKLGLDAVTRAEAEIVNVASEKLKEELVEASDQIGMGISGFPFLDIDDMVGKHGLDAVTRAEAEIVNVASEKLKEELVEASDQIGMGISGLPFLDINDVFFKGKNVVSSQTNVGSSNTEYFVSFPEHLSQEKMTSVFMSPAADSLVKQHEIWDMGFDTGVSRNPSPSHNVWENLFSYDVQDPEGMAGLSNMWDLGSLQADAGPGLDSWAGDESSLGDHETQARQLKHDSSKNMDP
ncbi:heat shock transcription factor A3 [Tasmannia lanceolata]|uniref:heat shock transcription factor A3 n=1 Tax=Tasmannia lanceolata TaxID=3420 RepID=UPI004064803A